MSGPASGWIRQGECNHCGYCCVFEGPTRVELTPQRGKRIDYRYYKLRGVPDGQMESGRPAILMHAYLPCSAWDAADKRCGVYQDRPSSCRVFPERPEQVLATPCSYWFQEVGGTRRIGGDGSPYPANTHEDGLALPRVEVPDPAALPCAPPRAWA